MTLSDWKWYGDLVREPGAVHESLGKAVASVTDGSISGWPFAGTHGTGAERMEGPHGPGSMPSS